MSLKDKASKINFGALASGTVLGAEVKQPKTAPGAMMAYANDARSDLMRENEELRVAAAKASGLEARLGEAVEDLRAWDGAKPTRLISPLRIARSRFANRHESSFDGDDFQRLKREIEEAGGNVQPIKVRPVTSLAESELSYEIVFGHRRHEACRQLGIDVLAVVDNLDDRSLFVEMERENRERQDLSPWEQGVMYARALDQGLFASNRQLAAALGIDHSNVGKSLTLARLPEEVVAAFRSPLEIQLRWAPLLTRAIDGDREAVMRRAQALAHAPVKGAAKDVLSGLVAEPVQSEVGRLPVVLEVDSKKAATLSVDVTGRVTVRFHVAFGEAKMSELRSSLELFLRSI